MHASEVLHDDGGCAGGPPHVLHLFDAPLSLPSVRVATLRVACALADAAAAPAVAVLDLCASDEELSKMSTQIQRRTLNTTDRHSMFNNTFNTRTSCPPAAILVRRHTPVA